MLREGEVSVVVTVAIVVAPEEVFLRASTSAPKMKECNGQREMKKGKVREGGGSNGGRIVRCTCNVRVIVNRVY